MGSEEAAERVEGESGVGEGIRTPDLQGHNLTP